MGDVAGFRVAEVEFTRSGAVHDPGQVEALERMVGDGVGDLLVLSHGWNNHMDEARELYAEMLASMAAVMPSSAAADRSLGVLAVLWPSKRFADEDLIAGGAASLGGPVTDDVLKGRIDDLAGVFDAPGADAALERAREIVPRLE